MKINKEGYGIITTLFLISAASVAGSVAVIELCDAPLWPAWVISIVLGVLLLLTLLFFREPQRKYISDDRFAFSPADGRVVVIEEVFEKEFAGEKRLQISVFMSLANAHMNWYPVSGSVVYRKYHPGEHLVAWHPKSSVKNERMTVAIDTGKKKIVFRQIAGYIARRIVSYAVEGVAVRQNTPCGFIKFGSRVDIFLPLGSEVLVALDQKVVGGITPLARIE